MRYVAFCLLALLFAPHASAQKDSLPKGIGAYTFGYRYFDKQTHKYDEDGQLQALGAPFSKEFSGQNLLDGAGGEQLKKLANELKKFDGNSTSDDSLLNTLNLGTLNIDVQAEITGQAIGLGYGFLNNFSGFLVVPWAEVSVDADITFGGDNNAAEIKSRLGDLAFDELKSGLDTAQNVNAQQIIDGITDLGYEDPRHWEHQGLGDVQFGTIFSGSNRVTRRNSTVQTLKTTVTVPTGYYEDPDILTDVSLSKGYYLLTNTYSQKLVFGRLFYIGADGTIGLGAPNTVSKRVPEENESLVNPDRTESVTLTPGADIGYGGFAGLKLGMFKSRYYLGAKSHLKDSYSGSIEGNYDKLSNGSDSYQLYHEPSVALDTTDAFKNGRFLLPLIAQIKAHLPIKAKNSLNDKSYELTLTSFFSTPYASTTKTTSKKPKKSKTKRKRHFTNKKKRKSKSKKTRNVH